MAGPSIPVSGVCELALEVPDLDAAEQFYGRILGFPVVERWSGEAIWVMAGPQTRIGLWLPRIGLAGGRGGVHVHYALHIDPPELLDAAVGRLREHGCTVTLEDFTGHATGRGRSAYVTDPAGHVVEFWTWDVSRHLAEYAEGLSPGSH